MEEEDYSVDNLQQLSYRVLQQIAKSMGLPSNVKKVYLIELIFARVHKTPAEVEAIVQRVKHERRVLTQNKNFSKKRKQKNVMQVQLQAMEISSTDTACVSPPIDITPKRSYSPEIVTNHRPIVRYHPPPSPPRSKSDRVLRSYNMRSYKRPNYSLLNDAVADLVTFTEKSSSTRERETKIRIYTHEGRQQQRVNVTARCVVRAPRPPRAPRPSFETQRSFATQTQTTSSALVPAKRVRTISGVYPVRTIPTPEKHLKTNFEYIQSIGFRRTDGKITTINAVVQKPTPKIERTLENFEMPSMESSYKNVEVTIQDIINSNIDSQTLKNPTVSEYATSNMTGSNYPMALSDVMPGQRFSQAGNEMDSLAVYNHKKIRAEQVRERALSPSVLGPSPSIPCLPPPNSRSFFSNPPGYPRALPGIDDTFNRFAQPLYVQVSDEAERILSYPIVRSNPMLETLYNLRSDTLSQPLLQIATTAATKCVYSTVTITTAMEQTPATSEPYPAPSTAFEGDVGSQAGEYDSVAGEVSQVDYSTIAEQDMTLRTYHEAFEADVGSQAGEYDSVAGEVSQVDYSTIAEQDMTLRTYHEASALNTSDSSPEADLASIPEMVEDALEIISQDGDYMDRICMDVRMQCILCSWAGSKIILDYHIRKEHASQITQQDKDEWNITYKLGTLVNQDLWLSHVCERNDTLYILSAKYEDPDCFMASLTTLPSLLIEEPKLGTITIFNKVTGEPYSWHDQIPQLPSNMPYDNGPNCLKIELSKLELLPNSANLKLHNRSLVLNSPSKVVVGQPELNDIHIIIFIKIQNV